MTARISGNGRARHGILLAGMLLAASGGSATAAEAPKGKGDSGPANTPSFGSDSSSTTTAGATSRISGGEEDVGGLADRSPGGRMKWFDVGATWETHGLLWQNNTNAGQRKFFNFAYAYFSLNVTRNDRFRIRGGFYEYLLADQTESGVRATDLSVSYSHLFRLPAKLFLRGTVAATIPISFYSQKASLYTAPTLSLALSRTYKSGISWDVNVFGGAYINKYQSQGGFTDEFGVGGGPNPLGVLGGSVSLEYAFWFHKPLVLGGDAYTGYLWYYNAVPGCPTGVNYGYGSGNCPGLVADANYTQQPTQQVYGFEVYLRYSLPSFSGVHIDLLAAIGEGDPTLGYVSRNIDGVAHFFGNYYQNFEAYGSASLRY